MKLKISSVIKIIISILIITFLFYTIGINKILGTLGKFNLVFLLYVIPLFMLTFLLGAMNIKLLTDAIRPIKFSKIFWVSWMSWAIGLVGPGKIGEFSIIYFLKKEKIPLGEGLAMSIVDKMTTFITLCLISYVGLFLIVDVATALKIIGVSLVLVVCGIAAIFSERVRGLIKKYILKTYALEFKGFYKTLLAFVKHHYVRVLLNTLLTFVKWLVSALLISLILSSYGYNTDVWIILIISSISTLLSLIPISISGLGVREMTFVSLSNLIAVPSEIALSTQLILTILSYALAFGPVIFFREKQKN